MSIKEHISKSYVLFFFILFISIKECSLIIIKWPFIVFSNSSAPLNDFLFLKNSDNFYEKKLKIKNELKQREIQPIILQIFFQRR